MIKLDEDALICDLAETYHIFDYEQLPVFKVAVFACGLPDSSRIKRKISGQKASIDTILLAGIVDRLSMLMSALSKSKKPPQSMVELLTHTNKDKAKPGQRFVSGKDFEKARQEMIIKLEKEGVDGN